MSERANELYVLTQKAQKMELINEEIALDLYLEIFNNHTPKISKTYESAIRLLEKRQRFNEAKSICEKAIELIKADEISGVLDKFETILERLDRKIAELNPEPQEVPRKKIKVKPIHVVLVLILITGGVYLINYVSPHKELDVDLTGKESLDGTIGLPAKDKDKDESYKKYPITESMIQVASSELAKFSDVSGADTIPQDDTLGIAIIVKAGTSEKRSKEIAILYLQSLAGAASAEYSDLKAPSGDSLGALYDHYELIISVGISQDEDDFTAKGTKTKGAKSIYWRKLD